MNVVFWIMAGAVSGVIAAVLFDTGAWLDPATISLVGVGIVGACIGGGAAEFVTGVQEPVREHTSALASVFWALVGAVFFLLILWITV